MARSQNWQDNHRIMNGDIHAKRFSKVTEREIQKIYQNNTGKTLLLSVSFRVTVQNGFFAICGIWNDSNNPPLLRDCFGGFASNSTGSELDGYFSLFAVIPDENFYGLVGSGVLGGVQIVRWIEYEL